MKELEERCLRFVLRHYRKNKLDTRQALKAFKEKHRIAGGGGTANRYILSLAGLAAAILLVFVVRIYLYSDAKWTEVAAYERPAIHMLPDGSAVTLFPHSAIRYCKQDYVSKRRDVRLEGKAEFVVRKDTAHPFTVGGRLSEVRVLGTRFVVDESRVDTASVQVESGRVRFSAAGQPEAVVLSAGMMAQVVKGKGKPQVVRVPENVKKGSFVFDNAPLSKVLDELSRYYKVKLTADRTDKRLTADFNARSLDEIIEIIEKVLKVNIEKKEQ